MGNKKPSNRKKYTSFFNKEANQTNEMVEQTLANKQEEINTLRNTIRELKVENIEHTDTIKGLNSEINQLTSRVAELANQNNRHKDTIDSLSGEITKLKDVIANLKKEIKSFNAKKKIEVNSPKPNDVINLRPIIHKHVNNYIPDFLPKRLPYIEGMVSIIVTNFNTAEYISKAINALLNQTYTNFEILIIDDNSTDKSLDSLNKFRNLSNVHIYKSPINVGPYVLKNMLIDKANGEFITVTDSDDVDLPNRLKEQIAIFKKNQNIYCVTCSFQRYNSKPRLGYPSMMFRREVFDKIGYYDSVRFAADSEFFERFKKVFGSSARYHINKVLQVGPRREDGLTGDVPENSKIRNDYFLAGKEWHKSTDLPYIEFPLHDRKFSANKKMLNDIEPQAYQVNKLENNTDVLAIVMCVWKRIEDFDLVVQQFNNQTFKNFKLFIWNNNTDPKYKNTFEEILNKKATFDWHIHHSNKNIGGFGRFYMAKQLRKVPGLANYVVFVDDDQRWGYDLLSTFWNEREPKTIKAQFGWRFDGNDYYRNRVHVSPGNSLHYTGTGGMILDNMIFEDDNLYEKCMPDHWWVEDLWLSYWANHIHGYKLTKSAASMKNGDDEHSLYRVVKDKKTPMLRWLLKEGNWGILNNSVKISTIMTSYLGDYPGSRTNPIEKFHRAINSWLNQDYQNKELIIVSDGCPITEAEVGKWNHIEQIKLVRANKSEATWPGSRRQMGVDTATGDWITYLDTDDMYAPNYLSEVANVITKHRDKQFILNRCLTQKIENEPSDQSVNVILKPVSITNGLSKFVLNGETHYYASRDSTTNSYSSAQIIHQKNIPYKWQDSDRRGEDVDFANKFKAEAIKISQPGYIICHMGHGASLDL